MRCAATESMALAADVLGGATLVALFFCLRREGLWRGAAPIYMPGAAVGAAYALVATEAAGWIDLGLPLRTLGGYGGVHP